MKKKIYLVDFCWYFIPVVLGGRIFGWHITILDIDLRLKERKISAYILKKGWADRIIAYNYSFGTPHTSAIEIADKIVDDMAGHNAIQSMVSLYGDSEVVLVFKKQLAEKMLVLTTVHDIMSRLGLDDDCTSESVKHWLFLGGQSTLFDLSNRYGKAVEFPPQLKVFGRSVSFLDIGTLTSISKLVLVVAGYCLHLVSQFIRQPSKVKTRMNFGVSLSAPFFEKFKGVREFTFLVDDKIIRKDQVAFLVEYPRASISFIDYKKKGYHVFPATTIKKVRHLFEQSSLDPKAEWLNVIKSAIYSWRYSYYAEAVICLLLTRLHWARVTAVVEFDNYIYCNKEGKHQLAANIYFRNIGVKTWNYCQFVGGPYQIDSSVTPFDCRHVIYSFLNCDYYCLNNEAMLLSMKKQHQHVRNYKVIGNIFGEMIKGIVHDKSGIKSVLLQNLPKGLEYERIITVFDTSYVDVAGVYSTFEEAEGFLSDLNRIAQSNQNVLFLFKPSKDDSWFVDVSSVWSSPEKGRGVVKMRKRFANLPNTMMLNDSADPAEVIAISDAVITNCFSSPTADALSAGIPAFWYQSDDSVRGYPLDKVDGLVVHGYDELLQAFERLFEPDFVESLYRQPLFRKVVNQSPNTQALNCFRRELCLKPISETVSADQLM